VDLLIQTPKRAGQIEVRPLVQESPLELEMALPLVLAGVPELALPLVLAGVPELAWPLVLEWAPES
jgi:hypothetical protein